MFNIETEITKEKKMILTIDLTKTSGVSKSKKSETIAGTNGNIAVGNNGMKLGLNLYRARELTPAVIKEIEDAEKLKALKV